MRLRNEETRGKIMYRLLALSCLTLSIVVIATACGGGSQFGVKSATDEDFVANVDDTRLNPTPTAEGDLGATTALGEYVGEGERGFGVPLEIKLGEILRVEEVIKVTLDFIGVVEDTRCPENETCDDPGRAAITLGIQSGGMSLGKTEFTLEGGIAGDPRKMGGKLSIQLLDLQPLPNADGSEVTDYVATIQLTR